MGCCTSFAKIILVLFNVLFLIAGLVLLGFGVALKVNPQGVFQLFTNIFKENNLESFLDGVTGPVGIGMIVLGCVVAVIAVLGIVGGASLSKGFLVPYLILLILILAGEIVLMILVVVLPAKFNGQAITDFSVQDSVFTKKYPGLDDYETKPPKEAMGKAWYIVQNAFGCCGWTDNADFTDANRNVNTENGVLPFALKKPSSCCKQKPITGFLLPVWNTTLVMENFSKCKTGESGFYNTDGCLNAFFFKASRIPIIIIGVTFGLEVILIVCAIIALCNKSKVSV